MNPDRNLRVTVQTDIIQLRTYMVEFSDAVNTQTLERVRVHFCIRALGIWGRAYLQALLYPCVWRSAMARAS